MIFILDGRDSSPMVRVPDTIEMCCGVGFGAVCFGFDADCSGVGFDAVCFSFDAGHLGSAIHD